MLISWLRMHRHDHRRLFVGRIFFIVALGLCVSGGISSAQEYGSSFPVWLPDGRLLPAKTEPPAADEYAKARIRSLKVYRLNTEDVRTDSSLLRFERYTRQGDALRTGLPLQWGVENDRSVIVYDDQGRKERETWQEARVVGCGTGGHARQDTKYLDVFTHTGKQLTAERHYSMSDVGNRHDTAMHPGGGVTYRYDPAGRLFRTLEYFSTTDTGGDTSGYATYFRYNRRGQLILTMKNLCTGRDDLRRNDSLWSLVPDDIADVMLRQSAEWRDTLLARWLPLPDESAAEELTWARDSVIDIRDSVDDEILTGVGMEQDWRDMTSYHYDKRGLLKRVLHFDREGLFSRDTFYYDSKRLNRQEFQSFSRSFNYDGVAAKSTSDFTYTPAGRLLTARQQLWNREPASQTAEMAAAFRPDNDITYTFCYDGRGYVVSIGTDSKEYNYGFNPEAIPPVYERHRTDIVMYEFW